MYSAAAFNILADVTAETSLNASALLRKCAVARTEHFSIYNKLLCKSDEDKPSFVLSFDDMYLVDATMNANKDNKLVIEAIQYFISKELLLQNTEYKAIKDSAIVIDLLVSASRNISKILQNVIDDLGFAGFEEYICENCLSTVASEQCFCCNAGPNFFSNAQKYISL